MSRMLFEYQVPLWYFLRVLLPFILNQEDEVDILFSFFAQEQTEAQRGDMTALSLAGDSRTISLTHGNRPENATSL